MGSLRVKKYIYHGGISNVFLGSFKGQSCVIKQYFAKRSKEFEREKETLRLLDCAYVARPIILGKSRVLGFNFEGTDLRSLIERDALGGIPVESISMQILRGLSYIHSRGVVHFDIKPSNILCNGGKIKIIDFGSAKYSDEVVTQYNCTNCFCSLEYLLGFPTARPCKDIWSFGCVLYELLCGKALFESEEALGVISEILNVFGSPADYERLNLRHMEFISIAGHKPENTMPKFDTIDRRHRTLLTGLMDLDPDARVSAETALRFYEM
jgi:serine/threonine protein kinase